MRIRSQGPPNDNMQVSATLITSTKFQLKLRVAPGLQRREVVVQGAKLVQLFQCLLLLNGDLMLSRVVSLHSGQFVDDFPGGMFLRMCKIVTITARAGPVAFHALLTWYGRLDRLGW